MDLSRSPHRRAPTPRQNTPMLLLTRQRHILVRRRVDMARNQTESGFPHPGADAIDGGLLPKRREDRALVDELLDPVQRRFAPRAIELARLLLEQRVDVRIVAVDIGAALHNEGFKPRGSVAE